MRHIKKDIQRKGEPWAWGPGETEDNKHVELQGPASVSSILKIFWGNRTQHIFTDVKRHLLSSYCFSVSTEKNKKEAWEIGVLKTKDIKRKTHLGTYVGFSLFHMTVLKRGEAESARSNQPPPSVPPVLPLIRKAEGTGDAHLVLLLPDQFMTAGKF